MKTRPEKQADTIDSAQSRQANTDGVDQMTEGERDALRDGNLDALDASQVKRLLGGGKGFMVTKHR